MNYGSIDDLIQRQRGINESRKSDTKGTTKFCGLRKPAREQRRNQEMLNKSERTRRRLCHVKTRNLRPSLPSSTDMLEQFKRVASHRRNWIRSGGSGSLSIPSSRRYLPICCRIIPLQSSVRDGGFSAKETKLESAQNELQLIIQLWLLVI